MDRFSEKSLLSLGDYYVYGLIDPRSKQIFYIGKGTKNRVFEHEKESLGSPDSEKLKLKTIADIKNAGFEVEKIIINSNLTEEEAFAAEASLMLSTMLVMRDLQTLLPDTILQRLYRLMSMKE